MSDAGDIRELLAGWPFDPENDARIVRGKDGRVQKEPLRWCAPNHLNLARDTISIRCRGNGKGGLARRQRFRRRG
jgi:hypothetical protein